MSNNIQPIEIVRLYRVWHSMMRRCHDIKCKQYNNYGGRGILVSDEWKDFNQFCFDVGQRPTQSAHLDRTDNNKGYEKSNFRWVEPKVNHRNKRNNKYYTTHLGKICQSELIEHLGYTRTQFRRNVQKYGIDKLLQLFKDGKHPSKRVVPDLTDAIGKKFGLITVISLDPDKSTGARYFCLCDCGRTTRITRHKLVNQRVTYCKSCSKRGDRNPRRRLSTSKGITNEKTQAQETS